MKITLILHLTQTANPSLVIIFNVHFSCEHVKLNLNTAILHKPYHANSTIKVHVLIAQNKETVSYSDKLAAND